MRKTYQFSIRKINKNSQRQRGYERERYNKSNIKCYIYYNYSPNYNEKLEETIRFTQEKDANNEY